MNSHLGPYRHRRRAFNMGMKHPSIMEAYVGSGNEFGRSWKGFMGLRISFVANLKGNFSDEVVYGQKKASKPPQTDSMKSVDTRN